MKGRKGGSQSRSQCRGSSRAVGWWLNSLRHLAEDIHTNWQADRQTDKQLPRMRLAGRQTTRRMSNFPLKCYNLQFYVCYDIFPTCFQTHVRLPASPYPQSLFVILLHSVHFENVCVIKSLKLWLCFICVQCGWRLCLRTDRLSMPLSQIEVMSRFLHQSHSQRTLRDHKT